MPTLSSKRRTWDRFRRKAPPTGYVGASSGGGPLFVDAYRSRRSPSDWEILEYYKGLIYIFANFNAFGAASYRLRMYVVTKGGQSKPEKYLGVTGVPRAVKARLKRLGYASKSVAGADAIEEVTDHPLLRSLEMVNPFMDHCQLIMNIVYSLDVIGDAYVYPTLETLGSTRTPMELWSLPAQIVAKIPSAMSMVPSGYQYGAKRYEIDELINFKWMSLRNPYMKGYSPAAAAIQYARLEAEWSSVQDSLLSNGPRPNILLTPKDKDGVIGEQERKRIRNEFNTQTRMGRQGGLVITDGAVDVKTLSYQLADLGQIKISEYDLDRVANCFDVPPPFYTRETNLANMQAAEARHARAAITPRHWAIASTLTRYFRGLDPTGNRGWDRILFAFDPCVQEDKQAEALLHKTYHDMGIQSTNEIRLEIDLEPIEDGDEILVANNLVRLQDVVAGVQELPDSGGALDVGEEQGKVDEDVEDENGDMDDGSDDEPEEPEGKSLAALARAAQNKAVTRVPSAEALLRIALENLGLETDYGDGSITPKQRLEVLHELRMVARAWLRREAERTLAEVGGDETESKSLAGDAKEAVGRFFKRAKRFVRNSIVAGVLALGGPNAADAQDMPVIEQQVAIQNDYFDAFQQAVMAEAARLEPGRAESYGASVWTAAQEVGRRRAEAAGLPYERRVHDGADAPCDDCVEEIDKGWVAISTLRDLGDSQCQSQCHCRFLFGNDLDADAGFGLSPWNMPIPKPGA